MGLIIISLILCLLSTVLLSLSCYMKGSGTERAITIAGICAFVLAIAFAVSGVASIPKGASPEYQETRAYCISIGGSFNNDENHPTCYLDGEKKELPK